MYYPSSEKAFPEELECKFQQLWPSASKQSRHVQSMLNRLSGWAKIIENLDEYFKCLVQMETACVESSKKLLDNMNAIPNDYGALSSCLEKMKKFNESAYARHFDLASNLQNSVCSKLIQVKKKISIDVANIHQETHKLDTNLRHSREEIVCSMVAFEKAYWATEASRSNIAGDPWLAEKVLKEKCHKLFLEEQNYQKAMITFHEEFKKMDIYLMESIQSVLDAYSHLNVPHLPDLMESANETFTLSQKIYPMTEYSQFFEKNGITNLDIWNEEIKPLSYRFQDGPLAQIVKYGKLRRRVGTLSVGWKECLIVISEGGFLHCFDEYPTISPNTSQNIHSNFIVNTHENSSLTSNSNSNGKNHSIPYQLSSPSVSICLRRAQIETPSKIPQNAGTSFTANPNPQLTFEIISTSTYLFSSSRVAFAANNMEELENWLLSITLKASEPENYSEIEDNEPSIDSDFILVSNKKSDEPTINIPIEKSQPKTDLNSNQINQKLNGTSNSVEKSQINTKKINGNSNGNVNAKSKPKAKTKANSSPGDCLSLSFEDSGFSMIETNNLE